MLTPEDADTTECWFEDDMLVLVINWQDGGYSDDSTRVFEDYLEVVA